MKREKERKNKGERERRKGGRREGGRLGRRRPKLEHSSKKVLHPTSTNFIL